MIRLIFVLIFSFIAWTPVTEAQAPDAPPPPPPLTSGAVPPPPPPVDASNPSADPNMPTGASDPAVDPLNGLLDPFDYQQRGRRDPFVKPSIDKPVAEGSEHGPFLPLQKYNLTELKLTGIIWDVKRPKAMIVDPENKVHIVGLNTKIGKLNGYIAVIREGEIVIVETAEDEGKLLSSTKILRLLSK